MDSSLILENILTRRSIRKYKKEDIPKKDIEVVLKAGMYAPSAVNKQPWHFIVSGDKQLFEEIISVHPNAFMLRGANKAIVVCGDLNLVHAEGYLTLDCSAAIQNILLAAHSMGIGACWIGIHPRKERVEKLKQLFDLPKHIYPVAMIAMGYPDENKHVPERFKPERIHYEKW